MNELITLNSEDYYNNDNHVVVNDGSDLVESLKDKLDNLNASQKSIEETAKLFIDISIMYDRFPDVIKLWSTKTTKNIRKLTSFIYLANHIIQESKRKGLNYYFIFYKEIKTILNKIKFPTNKIPFTDKQEILRIFEILIERRVFDEETEMVKEYYTHLASLMPKEANPEEEEALKEELDKLDALKKKKTEENIKGVLIENLSTNDANNAYDARSEEVEKVDVTNLNTKLRYLLSEYEMSMNEDEKRLVSNSVGKDKILLLSKHQAVIKNLSIYIKEKIKSDYSDLESYLPFFSKIVELQDILKKVEL